MKIIVASSLQPWQC